MGTPAGDYSFYQLALVAGLQKDYDGKVALLNRLSGKYPNSPYAINALYEKDVRMYRPTTAARPSQPSKSYWINIRKVRSAGKLPLKLACCTIRTMIMIVR